MTNGNLFSTRNHLMHISQVLQIEVMTGIHAQTGIAATFAASTNGAMANSLFSA